MKNKHRGDEKRREKDTEKQKRGEYDREKAVQVRKDVEHEE